MRSKCSVDGCDRLSQARALCKRHYERWRRFGTPEGPTPEQREELRQRRAENARRVRASFTPEQRSDMISRGNRSRALKRRGQLPSCSAPECVTAPRARGMCDLHYQRARRAKAKGQAHDGG